jgi:hypothetical protein
MRHPDGARAGGRTALQPLFSPWQALGFDVDRLISIVNRLGSRVEVKVKVRRVQLVERRATIAVLTRRPS